MVLFRTMLASRLLIEVPVMVVVPYPCSVRICKVRGMFPWRHGVPMVHFRFANDDRDDRGKPPYSHPNTRPKLVMIPKDTCGVYGFLTGSDGLYLRGFRHRNLITEWKNFNIIRLRKGIHLFLGPNYFIISNVFSLSLFFRLPFPFLFLFSSFPFFCHSRLLLPSRFGYLNFMCFALPPAPVCLYDRAFVLFLCLLFRLFR